MPREVLASLSRRNHLLLWRPPKRLHLPIQGNGEHLAHLVLAIHFYTPRRKNQDYVRVRPQMPFGCHLIRALRSNLAPDTPQVLRSKYSDILQWFGPTLRRTPLLGLQPPARPRPPFRRFARQWHHRHGPVSGLPFEGVHQSEA